MIAAKAVEKDERIPFLSKLRSNSGKKKKEKNFLFLNWFKIDLKFFILNLKIKFFFNKAPIYSIDDFRKAE